MQVHKRGLVPFFAVFCLFLRVPSVFCVTPCTHCVSWVGAETDLSENNDCVADFGELANAVARAEAGKRKPDQEEADFSMMRTPRVNRG